MQESAASCSSDAAKEAKNNWTAEKPSSILGSQRSITIDLAKYMKDSSDSEDEDDVSEVDSFIMDQGDLDEESVIETSKFLLSSEGADSLDLRSADPESQAKLEALLEAAGKLSMADGKHFVDSDALRRVSCALGKAAAFPGAKTDDFTAGCVATFSAIKAQAMKAHAASHLVQSEVSLAEACSGGHVGVVKKLLDEGRSVNETTEEGESLLSLACQAGYYELAQVLLAMRANVEDRGMKGDCTPLMEAASTGHVEIVKLLISHGADVNAQSSSGNTPLMYACAGGHEDVVKVLLDAGANVEDHNENGHTPLMEAASAGHVGVAKILLEKGAGINTHSNEFKESALTLACYKGHLEMVRFLLEAGADQEHKTDEMHTALMEASMDGHVEVARLLLNSGAQVNMPADSFESPLTLAACGGHVELAMLLLERGAKIEEVNDEGYTPLMEAAREGHEEMVALLLSQGADINAQTEETQETALTLACCGGFLEVADLLIKAGADIEMGASTPLMEAAQEGHRALVRYLLEAGTNVHAHTQTADTALTYACENGHTDVADLLLQAGADLEHESEGGRTPLMKAARAGHLCTVQFLISRGADVNRQTTNNDHTPLSLACAGGHQAVVELLLAHGSNPSHKLKDSSTMLIEASKGGHTNVVQLLLDYPHNMAPRVPPHGLHVMSPAESDQSLVVPHAYLPNLQSAPRLSEGGMGVHEALPQNVQHVVVKQGDQKHYAGSSKTPVLHSDDFLTSAELQQVRNTPHLVPEVNYDFEGGGIGYTDSVGVLGLGGPESEDKDQRPADRLESCINSMVKKAVQYPNPEEQILQKQKILEELQRVERELQDKAQAQLMLGSRQCQDHHHSHSQMLTLSDHDTVDSLSLSHPCDGLGSTVSEVAERAKLKAVAKKDAKGGKQKAFDQQHLVSKDVDSLAAVTVEAFERLQLSQIMAPDDQQPLAEEALEQLNRILVDVALLPDTSNTGQDFIPEKVSPNRGVASADTAKSSPAPSILTPAEQVTHDKSDQKTKAAAKVCVPTTAVTGGTSSSSTTCKSHVNSVAVNTCSLMGNRQQTAAGKVDDVSHLTAGSLPSVAPASHTCGQTKIPQLCAQQLFLPTNNVATQYMDPSLPPHSRPFLAHPPATSPNTAFSLNLPTLQNFQSLDVDSQTDSNHDTALTLACAGGHDDLVQLLLSRGAAIEHRDKKGFTPLILAATAGHVTVVDLLLNSGAEIEAQSERTKDTPLSLACSGGRYEVVELLLTRNANKEHRNVSDYTPLSLAASSGYVNIIKLLLTHGAEINSRTGSKLGISPLMLAAMNGHTAAVKLLLDMGSDINAQIETNRNTALTLACFQGRHDVVSLLVDRRANVEHRAKTGLTPLMEAASGGHVEVGRVLLDKGADVNAPPVPSSRDTALTIAADRGHYRFVELLLSKNAQVDVKNKKGNSPLWLSANGGHMDVVQLLVSSGADIDSQDNRKVSCLMAAFRKGHIKVVKWMVKHVSQFPSDQEMTRFISTVSDKELLKKCHQCLEIIRAAKDRQAAEANKNATLLLVELDMEKTREESKKAAAARRRERKRKKKKEKLERKILDEENRKNESKNSEDRHRHHSNVISMDGKGIGRNSNQSNKFAGKGRGNATNSHLANNRSGMSNHVDKYNRGQSNDESDDSDMDNSSSSSSSEDSPVERFSLKEKRTRHEPEGKDRGKQGSEGTARNVPPKYKDLFKEKKKPDNLPAEVVSSTRNKNSSATSAATSTGTNKKKDIGEINMVTPQVTAAKTVVKAKKGEPIAPTTVMAAQSKAGNVVLNAAVTSSSAAAIASPKRGAKREDEWKEVVRRCEKSKKVLVSATAISRVIGRGGCHINAIREASGAIIEIEKQKGMGDKTVIIRGSAEATRHAHQLILSLVKDPECDLAEILPKGVVNRPSTTGKSSSASGGSSSCSQQSAKSSTSQSSGSQSKASSTSSGSLGKVMSLSGGMNSTSFGNTSTTMNATPGFNMPNPPFSAPLRQPNSTIRPAMTVPPMSGPFPGSHVWPAFPGPGPTTSGKRSSGPPGQASSQPVSTISATRTATAISTSAPTTGSSSNLTAKNAQQQPSSGKSSAVRQLFASDSKKISAPGQSTVISAPVKASKTQAATGIGGGATFAAKVIENKNVPVSTATSATQSSGSSGNRQTSGGGKNTGTGSVGGIRPAQSAPNISQASSATNSSSGAPKRGVSVPNGPIPANANAQQATAPSPTAFLTQFKIPPTSAAPASAQSPSVMVRQMSVPLVQTNMQHQQQSQHQQQMLFSQNQQLMLQQQQQQNVTQEYSPFNNLFSVHSWVKESESSNKGMNFASVAAANVKSSSSSASSVSSAMAALESVPVPAADASKAVGYRGNVASNTSSHGTTSTSAPTSSSPRDFQGRLPSSAPCTPPLGPIAPLNSTLMRKESPPLLQSPNTGLRNMVDRDQVTPGSNCSSGSPAAGYGVPNMAPMSSPPNPPVMHGGPPPCPMQVPMAGQNPGGLARVIEMQQQQHQHNLSHQHQQHQHVHHHQHIHMAVNSFANPSHHSSAPHRFPSVSAAGQHFNNGLVSSTSVNSNVNLSTGNNGAGGASSGQGQGQGQSQQAMTSVLSNLNPNAPDFSSRSAPPHSSSSAPSSAMAMHSHPQQHAMPFGRYPGMKEALHGPMATGTPSANGSSSFRPLFGVNHNPQGTPNSGMPFMTTHPSQASGRMPFPPNSGPNPNQQQQQLAQHLGPHGQADFSQHPSSLASLRHGSGTAGMMSSSLEALGLMGTLSSFGQGHMAHSHPMLGHGNHGGPGHMQPLVGGVNLPAFAGLSGSVHQSHRSSNNTQHVGSSSKEEAGSPITNISPVQSPHPSNPTSPMTMLGLQGEQAMKMMSEDRKLPRPIGMERAHHRKGPAFNSSSDTGSIWAFASSGNMRSDWASVNQSGMASEGPQMQPDDGMSSMHSGYLGRFADSLGPLENSLHHMDQSFQPHMMTNNQHPTNINSPYPPFVNGVPPQILNHIYNSAAAAAAMSNNGLSINEIWNKIGHVDGGPGNMVGPMHPQQTQQQQQSSGSMSTVNSNSIGGQPSGIVIAGPGVVPGPTTALQHLPENSMMWNNWM